MTAKLIDRKTILRFLGLFGAVASLVTSCCLTVDGLSEPALRTLGVLIAALFLLIFETFNVCVSCMLSCAMLFATGCVDTIAGAFSGFTNHIIYFTTASFGISLAFQKSALSRLFLRMVMGKKKRRVKTVIFIFMFCSAMLSSIMSNVAAVVIFIPFAEHFLSFYKDEAKRRQTSRCMMICLAVSAMIGGMMTPAGSSMNLIAGDMLETYAGITVRFIDWVLMGMPLAFIVLTAAFLIITVIYKPAALSDEEMGSYTGEISEKPVIVFKDIYTAIVILGVVATWVISSWVPAINITVTSIIGLAFLFMPKLSVMTGDEFLHSISWPTFFVAGSLITIANTAISTGLCRFFTGLLFPENVVLSDFFAIMLIAAMTFVFMAFLPSAPAVITILSPLIITFAQENGIDPYALVMASALCVSNIYLFPLDAPLVVAYDKKAFTMFELPRATVWIQLIMILIVPIWISFIFNIVF